MFQMEPLEARLLLSAADVSLLAPPSAANLDPWPLVGEQVDSASLEVQYCPDVGLSEPAGEVTPEALFEGLEPTELPVPLADCATAAPATSPEVGWAVPTADRSSDAPATSGLGSIEIMLTEDDGPCIMAATIDLPDPVGQASQIEESRVEQLTETLRAANGPPTEALKAPDSGSDLSSASSAGTDMGRSALSRLSSIPAGSTRLTLGQWNDLLVTLSRLADWIDGLETLGLLGSPLPLVGESIGGFLGAGDVLKAALQKMARWPVGVDDLAASTLAGWIAQCSGGQVLKKTGPPTDEIVVRSQAVTFLSVTPVVAPGEIRFDIVLRLEKTHKDQPISLGQLGVENGIVFGAEAQVELTAVAEMQFSLGIDLQRETGSPDAGFIRVQDFRIQGGVAVTNLASFPASVGVLGSTVSNASVNLAVNLQVAVLNPDNDPAGRITTEELMDTEVEAFVQVSKGPAGNTLTASFPVSATLGTYSTSGTVTVSDSDLYVDPAPVLSVANFGGFQNFIQFRPATLTGILDAVGAGLAVAQASPAFQSRLPFLGQLTWAALPSLETSFANGLNSVREVLPSGVAVARFATIQEMVRSLAAGWGVSETAINPQYDGNTGVLTFRMGFEATTPAASAAMDFAYDLGPLRNVDAAGAQATLTPSAKFSLLLGIDIRPLGEGENYQARSFIQNASVEFRVGYGGASFTTNLVFGYLGLTATGTISSANAALIAEFKDPATGQVGAPIGLGGWAAKLVQTPAQAMNVRFEGSASADFVVTGVPTRLVTLPAGTHRLQAALPIDPGVMRGQTGSQRVGWTSDFLTQYSQLSFARMVAGLRQIADFLGSLGQTDLLGAPLPFVSRSLGELLPLSQDLHQRINQLEAAAPLSLQALRSALPTLFGLSSTNVVLSVTGGEVSIELRGLQTQYSGSLPIQFDLGSLTALLGGSTGLEALPFISPPADGPTLSATAQSDLTLRWGINVADGQVFVRDTSTLSVQTAVRGRDLTFDLLGNVADLRIQLGSFALDSDGNPATTSSSDVARLNVGLLPSANGGKYGVSELAAVVVAPMTFAQGQGKATLPLYRGTQPIVTSPGHNISVSMTDLGLVMRRQAPGTTLTLTGPDLRSLAQIVDPNLRAKAVALGLADSMGPLRQALVNQLSGKNLPLLTDAIISRMFDALLEVQSSLRSEISKMFEGGTRSAMLQRMALLEMGDVGKHSPPPTPGEFLRGLIYLGLNPMNKEDQWLIRRLSDPLRMFAANAQGGIEILEETATDLRYHMFLGREEQMTLPLTDLGLPGIEFEHAEGLVITVDFFWLFDCTFGGTLPDSMNPADPAFGEHVSGFYIDVSPTFPSPEFSLFFNASIGPGLGEALLSGLYTELEHSGGSWNLSVADLKNSAALANKLRTPGPDDTVSTYLRGQLTQSTRDALDAWSGSGEAPTDLITDLINDLNIVINRKTGTGNTAFSSLWREDRFAGVALRPATQAVIDANLLQHAWERAHLNRLLIEDAYPQEIDRSTAVHSTLSGRLRFDLKDPMTLGSLQTLSLEEMTQGWQNNPSMDYRLDDPARPDGQAVANLYFKVRVQPGDQPDAIYPKIRFQLDVRYPVADELNNLEGDPPQLAFNNIYLSIGPFFEGIVKPVVRDLQALVKPLLPIVDALNSNISNLADVRYLRNLMDQNHDKEVSLLELLEYLEVPAREIRQLQSILKLIELVDVIPLLPAHTELFLGSFNIDGNDLRQVALKDILLRLENCTIPVDMAQELDFFAKGEFQRFLDKVAELNRDWPASAPLLAVPFLTEPTSLYELLMGKTVDLVRLSLSGLRLNGFLSEFDVFFLVDFLKHLGMRIDLLFLNALPIAVSLRGPITLSADLVAHFDTSGFRLYAQNGFANFDDVMSGFYVEDQKGGSQRFTLGDFVDLPDLVNQLKQPARAFDTWLVTQLSSGTKTALQDYAGSGPVPMPLQLALLDDLNRVLNGASIYQAQRFVGITIRSETQKLLDWNPAKETMFWMFFGGKEPPSPQAVQLRLNRLLFEDAYPTELAQNQNEPSLDTPEFSLSVKVEGKVALVTAIGSPISLGLSAPITANIKADLVDANRDGRISYDELFTASQEVGVGDFGIDLSGKFKGRLKLGIEFGFWPFSFNLGFTIFSWKLLDFDHSGFTDKVGIMDEEGTLTLNVGAYPVEYTDDQGRTITTNAEAIRGPLDEWVRIYHVDGQYPSETVRVEVNNSTQTFTGVKRIVANTGKGNDTIMVIRGVQAFLELSGGDGDDEIGVEGSPHTVRIYGGPGDDVLKGGDGPNLIQGGPGDDEIYGGKGADRLYGDDGNDTIHGFDGDDEIHGGPGSDALFGGKGADRMFGDDGDDRIYGEEGDDELDGGDGSDWISGGEGDDVIRGGAGNDYLAGELGVDEIYGDDGDDVLAAHFLLVTLPGFDTPVVPPEVIGQGLGEYLHGGAGNDTLYGSGNDDRIYGGSGADLLLGGDGWDELYGGDPNPDLPDGNDRIYGEDGDDYISDDGGDDYLNGGPGNDEIGGGLGNDTIIGGVGNDRLYGGDDDDYIEGNGGDDFIDGGAGNDRIYGHHGNDQLFGSLGNDWIDGGPGQDQIYGGAGDDTLFGSGGADVIWGDAGADHLDGGNGDDVLYGHSPDSASDDGAADVIWGGYGRDTIYGGDGDDELFGEGDADLVCGGGGNDQIDGGTGNDTIYGGTGNDILKGGKGDDDLIGDEGDDTLEGEEGSDRLWGGSGNDVLKGGKGRDVLRGGEGNDRLSGGEDDDVLYGDEDDDVLEGDAGRDRLYGGAGNDQLYGYSELLPAGLIPEGDYLYGEDGDDMLIGGMGDDFLDGGAGKDTLEGGEGDDILIAGTGVGDILRGGPGDDWITGSDEGSDTFALPIGTTGDVIDGGPGNDRIWGLGGADFITGGEGDDWIDSGAGADRVNGGDGNDWIYAGRGLGDDVDGGAGDDTIYGSNDGHDVIEGGAGHDLIFAQGGNDIVRGGTGDDTLDGGSGADQLYGDDGDDVLWGGGGTGDRLEGGNGNDILHGSDDGNDTLLGGAGADILFGYGGNDILRGEADDDILDGGPGDDLLEGGAGSDLLIGGAHHDRLYGHTETGAGDDNAVDYLYGDFGTNGSEPNSGRDRLFGGGGNDILFGEGEDDYIEPGAGDYDIWFHGPGEEGSPNDYVTPTPTPAPALVGPPPDLISSSATLAEGIVYAGRWSEFANSASGSGLSGDPSLSVEPSVAVSGDGRIYVAWADARHGNFEIYVAVFSEAAGWQQLGGSASQGGISNTATSSRQPVIALNASGRPVVAWTEYETSTSSNIRAVQWDPGSSSWLGLGASNGTGGLSQTGKAKSPSLVLTTSGPVVGWLDSSSGVANLYARRFSGSSWLEFSGSASSGGISQSATAVKDPALTSDGAKLAAAWVALNPGTGRQRVYVAEFVSSWTGLAGSNTGDGITDQSFHLASPTMAYHAGSLFVAWQADVRQGAADVFARRFDGASWVSAGVGADSGLGVSQSGGHSTRPQLRSGGGKLYLAWADDTLQSRVGDKVGIYVKHWNGSAFIEELDGDATHRGISYTGAVLDALSLTVDSAGQPYVVWASDETGSREVHLRGNRFAINRVLEPSTTLQQLLDQETLGPGDVILLRGEWSESVTVGAGDAGVMIYGAPGQRGSLVLQLTQANGVILQRITTNSTLTLTNSVSVCAVDSSVGSLAVQGGSNHRLGHLTAYSITLQDVSGARVEWSLIANRLTLVSGVTNVAVLQNVIQPPSRAGLSDPLGALEIAASASGRISGNVIRGGLGGTGLRILATFTGPIEHNVISDSRIGVAYLAPAALGANDILRNEIGIDAWVDGAVGGLGFYGAPLPNRVHHNQTGILLQGYVQNQRVYANQTGISGTGRVGPEFDDFDHANQIESNGVGVSVVGDVQFNRILKNTVGVDAKTNSHVVHNVFAWNQEAGVRVAGARNVRIFHNSFHSAAGRNISLESAASDVQILNNVLSTETGYDVYVANDSTVGYFSDYNNLYAGAAGKLVYWGYDFKDLLDWREDVYLYDLHSNGSIATRPAWSVPRFLNRGQGDLREFGVVAQQQFSSPGMDAGAPFLDAALPASYVNLLANPGFESGTTGWTVSPEGTTRTGAHGAYDGTAYFFSGSTAQGRAAQTVDLVSAGFAAADLDSRDFVAVFSGRLRSSNEALVDQGQISLIFLNQSGVEIGRTTVAATNPIDRWELVGARATLPAGTRQIRYEFEGTRRTGTTNDAYLDRARLYVLPDTVAPDLGAYGNTALDRAQAGLPRIVLESPDVYLDWVRNRTLSIRWDSFNNLNELAVRIDLLKDGEQGPAHLLTIAEATEDDGEFLWSPANSNVSFGTYGLRIQVSLVNEPIALDRGAEPFTVPESGNTFYVNDRSTSNDAYNWGAGANRNTGMLPESPKANPVNVLRIYTLGVNQRLRLNTGQYPLVRPLLISNVLGVGDDEGFALEGPGGSDAKLYPANPLMRWAVVELFDADSVRIQGILINGGGIGLHVRGESRDLVVSGLIVTNSAGDGVRIESGSQAERLSGEVSRAGGHGLWVRGEVRLLERLTLQNNQGDGLNLEGRFERLTESVVSDNGGTGIKVAYTGATMAWIGDPANFEKGNLVYNNGRHGIEASGVLTIKGNRVYGHRTTLVGSFGAWGILATAPVVVQNNVVYGNRSGISGGEVIGNRVYDHLERGISGTRVVANVVYQSRIGITGVEVRNNVVYANKELAVSVGGVGALLINNTLVATEGDLLRVTAAEVRNNIFSLRWVPGSTARTPAAVVVADAIFSGLVSDYNLFEVTGGADVFFWQNQNFDLPGWRALSSQETHSLTGDPAFVNRTAGDYHLQSLYGSFHDGSLAPVYQTSVSPYLFFPTPVEVQDAVQSPGIDAGLATDPFGQEPTPNGGYVNLGAYGNTAQASKSPTEYLLVLSPSGGETLLKERDFSVTWRSHNQEGTVRIELWLPEGASPALTIESATENDGDYLWSVPSSVASASYVIRITRNDSSGSSHASYAPFAIVDPVKFYYVNDATVESGDWTTAPGSNSNDGLSSDKPKDSIQAVLLAYDLGPGDVIRVDAGTYKLQANIKIEAQDAGVTIEGYNDAAYPDRSATLDRNNTSSSGSYVFELVDADNVTLSHLSITNAYVGVYASATSDSDGVTLINNRIFFNGQRGIHLLATNDGWLIANNEIYGNTDVFSAQRQAIGIQAQGAADLVVANNRVYDSIWVTSTSEGPAAIKLTDTPRAVVRGNEVFGNTNTYDKGTGIEALGTNLTSANRIELRNNLVYNNRLTGISASGQVLVVGNHVYGHLGTNAIGVSFSGSAVVLGNVVCRNLVGIQHGGTVPQGLGRILDNRVFGNTTGIRVFLAIGSGTMILGNQVYGNDNGIELSVVGTQTVIANNVFYSNRLNSIHLNGATEGTKLISNNTVLQTQGTALRVSSSFSTVQGLQIENNLFVASAGEIFSVAPLGQQEFRSDYNLFHLTGTALLAVWDTTLFTNRLDWYFETRQDAHSLVGDPQLIDPDGEDDVLGYDATGSVDYGADDRFFVAATSPTVDAGNPASPYLEEPMPNGGRVNIGAYGNTSRAALSSPVVVQLLSPNGDEHFVLGQSVPVEVRSFGLTDDYAVALLNVNGLTTGLWAQDDGRYRRSGTTGSTSNTINLTKVTDPAPLAVYQRYAQASSGVGQRLSYSLPVPNGTYQLRLHFMETNSSSRFDILLNGEMVRDDFSIYSAAGGVYLAWSESFTVTAAGEQGISLELVNRSTSGAAILCGIELTMVNAAAPVDRTIQLQLSADAGGHWAELGSVTVDRRGNAVGSWIAGPTVSDHAGLMRASYSGATLQTDQSDAPFSVWGPTTHYYVNDGSGAGDVFTTAIGNNANSGRSPDRPMASLLALLATYSFSPGDVIHVDAGSYVLGRNLLLGSGHSGLRIEGPAGAEAVLTRTSTASGLAVFELVNADLVTLERLTLVGGEFGVTAAISSDSDGLVVRSCRIQGQGSGTTGVGINLLRTNDNAVIEGNELWNQSRGMIVAGNDLVIRNNVVRDSRYAGINVSSGERTLVESNQVTGAASYGLLVTGPSSNEANRIVVRQNTVANSSGRGISAKDSVLVDANTVSGHAQAGLQDSLSAGGARVQFVDNVVYGNGVGIENGGVISGNRVFQNTTDGILITSPRTLIAGNRIYSNDLGIRLAPTTTVFSPTVITGNLIYAQTNRGIVIEARANQVYQILGNTIYQTTGECLQILGPTGSTSVAVRQVTLRNNILVAGAGPILSLAQSSELADGDYNLFHWSTGPLAVWGDTTFADVEAWYGAVGYDGNSLRGNPLFVNIWGADGILGYATATQTDGGADDDFRVQPGSPAIDAGDPAAGFTNEPLPNGNRLNLGAYGNTAQATRSPAQFIQVISPNGREKIEAGQLVSVVVNTSQGGVAGASVQIDATADGGLTWTPIASAAAVDPQGTARADWVPGSELAGQEWRVRAVVRGNASLSDWSDRPFLIVPDSPHFYVNDSSTAGDVFTTAPGNNAWSGKAPDRPMASIDALLRAYNLEPGDVVHVDTGNYRLFRSLVITADDAGVALEGPPGATAVLDRRDTSVGAYGIELRDAAGVRISSLSITGAEYGLYGPVSVDTLISGNRIYANAKGGIYLGGADQPRIENNVLYGLPGGVATDNQLIGIELGYNVKNSTIVGNRIYDSTEIGISGQSMLRGLIEANEIYGCRTGIIVNTTTSNATVTIRNNVIYNNATAGLSSYGDVVVEDNRIYGHVTGTDTTSGHGINGASIARNNTVYGNRYGISNVSQTLGNWVFNNSVAGMLFNNVNANPTINGNRIYSNPIGIQFNAGGGVVSNNVIYANTNQGLVIQSNSTNLKRIVNNTIVQNVGDAIRLQNSTKNVSLRNNIISIQSGHAIFVAADSKTTFSSDYNLIHVPYEATSRCGSWDGVSYTWLSSWQNATGLDPESRSANPGFVDADGADNILGYSATHGDRGRDDNFMVGRNSSAIDAALSSWAPLTDLLGTARSDDPDTWNRDPAGFADIGAYEFRGSSSDATPPLVVGTVPAELTLNNSSGGFLTRIEIVFSEGINPIDAIAGANFELRYAGPNGLFGDDDDALLPLTITPDVAGHSVILELPSGYLLDGFYRVRVSGNSTVHDWAGLALDGNGDGVPGGDYVLSFEIDTQPTVTIDVLITTNTRPTLTGTIADPEATIVVTLGGRVYSVTNPGDGTWTLPGSQLVAALALGTYDVVVRATDADGDVATDSTTNELQVRSALTTGFEGDAAPRPGGNGVLTVTDWVQVGRFVAGLDEVSSPDEFQRVDCAPRATLGDGRLTVTDWVQAGRYVAGLDEKTDAGGPSAPIGSSGWEQGSSVEAGGLRKMMTLAASELRLESRAVAPEGTVSVGVQMVACGTENAVGFTLSFDPASERYEGVRLATDAAMASATLLVNDVQAAEGRIWVGLALAPGASFAAGVHGLVEVTFQAASTGGDVEIAFAPTTADGVVDVHGAARPVVYGSGVMGIRQVSSEHSSATQPLATDSAVSDEAFIRKETAVAAASATRSESLAKERLTTYPSRLAVGNRYVQIAEP